MTTIISRVYADAAAADAVAGELRSSGFPDRVFDVLAASEGEKAGAVAERIRGAGVAEAAAATYAKALRDGKALVVVRAPFTPLGAARLAMKIVDKHSPIDVGVKDDNRYVRTEMATSRQMSGKVIEGGKHYLTNVAEIRRNRGPVTAGFGMKMLSDERPRTSAVGRARTITGNFFPLISERPPSANVGPGETISSKLGFATIYRRH